MTGSFLMDWTYRTLECCFQFSERFHLRRQPLLQFPPFGDLSRKLWPVFVEQSQSLFLV